MDNRDPLPAMGFSESTPSGPPTPFADAVAEGLSAVMAVPAERLDGGPHTGYSSLRHARGPSPEAFGVRSSRNEW